MRALRSELKGISSTISFIILIIISTAFGAQGHQLLSVKKIMEILRKSRHRSNEVRLAALGKFTLFLAKKVKP